MLKSLQNSPTPPTAAKKQLSVTSARTALHGGLSSASQPSQEARLYTAAKQLKPPAKRAASSAMVKQN